MSKKAINALVGKAIQGDDAITDAMFESARLLMDRIATESTQQASSPLTA